MAPRFVSGAAYFSRGFDGSMVKEDLVSQNEPRQLSALYQVIAYMSMGRDMSNLFNEVSALTSSTNTTMKRLVYLYLVENSRVQPERTVLQAGTLVKDTLHDSPLARGAALRTMTNIQLQVMADFYTGPLLRCLEDSSPYVRRVAVMGVLKQYSVAPNVATEAGLLDRLHSLAEDENAMVAASAVEVMLELQYRNAPVSYVSTLIKARSHFIELLSVATEWSTVALLEGIAISTMIECRSEVISPPTRRSSTASTLISRSNTQNGFPITDFIAEGEETLQAVMPKMQYASSSTVLSTVRVITLFLRSVSEHPNVHEVERNRLIHTYAPHVVRSLISLLEAARFEMRYVVLRNITLFLTPLYTQYFAVHLDKFLVNFEDPVYIKMEKLSILVQLANHSNGSRVLEELMVYARESDVELVRTSIQSIGTLATKLSELSVECMKHLGLLIATRVPHIVENSAVVVQTVLRCYPGKFMEIIPALCASLTTIEMVEAKSSVVWLLGEYPDAVSESLQGYLTFLVDNFSTEPRLAQFAIITTLVKLHLRDQAVSGVSPLPMLEKVLGVCADSYLPDLRDRAFFYWRLVALDPLVAKQVIAETEGGHLDAAMFNVMEQHTKRGCLSELGTIASISQQPLRLLLGDDAIGGSSRYFTGAEDADDIEEDDDSGEMLDAEGHSPRLSNGSTKGATEEGNLANNLADLSPPAGAPTGTPVASHTEAAPAASAGYTVVLRPAECSGVQVEMAWSQLGTKLLLLCRMMLAVGEDNVSRTRVLTMQINWNMFGLGVAQVFPPTVLDAEDKAVEMSVVVGCNNQKRPSCDVQVAVELESIGVRYAVAPPIPPALLLLPATGCSPQFFAEQWSKHPVAAWNLPPQLYTRCCEYHRLSTNSLRVHCLNLVYRKDIEESRLIVLLLFAETIGHQRIMAQATISAKGAGELVSMTVRCDDAPIAAHFGEYIVTCLCP